GGGWGGGRGGGGGGRKRGGGREVRGGGRGGGRLKVGVGGAAVGVGRHIRPRYLVFCPAVEEAAQVRGAVRLELHADGPGEREMERQDADNLPGDAGHQGVAGPVIGRVNRYGFRHLSHPAAWSGRWPG